MRHAPVSIVKHTKRHPLGALLLVTFARLSALRALRIIHKFPQIKKFIDSFHTTIFFLVCVRICVCVFPFVKMFQMFFRHVNLAKSMKIQPKTNVKIEKKTTYSLYLQLYSMNIFLIHYKWHAAYEK